MVAMQIFLSLCASLLLSRIDRVKAQDMNSTTTPSSQPTLASTVPPSLLPTFSPTISSSSRPSIQETFAPSDSPSQRPTIIPTVEPTVLFSEHPSQETSQNPSLVSSESPSQDPSVAPSYFPTLSPSKIPSYAPSFHPSQKSLTTFQKSIFKDLQMVLKPMDEMDDKTISDWENVTSDFIENYYTSETETVRDVSIETEFTSQSRTNEDELIIFFDQTVSFRNSSSIPAETLISDPFNTLNSRRNYIKALKNKNNEIFVDLTTASTIDFPSEPRSSIILIIIIAIVSAVGVAILFIALFFYRRRKKNSSQTKISSEKEAKKIDDLNPEDEINNEVILRVEDEPSVSTMDYDYSKAFTGDGSVSSAGGTWGENTRNTQGMTIQSSSLFSNDDSFQNHYTGTNANVKETIINIFAPPGKLGVVIDTPDDGAPVVHAIKDTSVIADKLKVGDLLVAVDGEDVRKMTAIKVSKLISRKSINKTRKLSVIRSTVVE